MAPSGRVARVRFLVFHRGIVSLIMTGVDRVMFRTASRLVSASLSILLLLALSGCVEKIALGDKYDACLSSGLYADAAESSRKDAEGSDILASLNYGYALRCSKDYEGAVVAFDKAEALFKAIEEDSLLSDTEKTVAAALVNEGISSYSGKLYEFTLVNTYKAMSFIKDGQHDLARVELNRALDRQRRARQFFEAELERAVEKSRKEQAAQTAQAAPDAAQAPKAPQLPDAAETARREDVSKELAKHYSNIGNFEPYADYTNPFVTYFAGLYFLLERDYAKSLDLLKEAAAMCPENEVAQADFLAAQAAAKGLGAAPGGARHAWVVFENGVGPGLESLTIPLPLFLVTDQVAYTEVALPRLTGATCATQRLVVRRGEGVWATQALVDMDDVVQAEFDARFQAQLIRAILGAVVKAGLQAGGKELGGDLAKWGLGIYSALVTRADTRHWSSVPARYEVARVPLDGAGDRLWLDIPGGRETALDLDPGRDHIVFVALRSANANPYIDTVAFD